jgi:hypothetical protein
MRAVLAVAANASGTVLLCKPMNKKNENSLKQTATTK